MVNAERTEPARYGVAGRLEMLTYSYVRSAFSAAGALSPARLSALFARPHSAFSTDCAVSRSRADLLLVSGKRRAGALSCARLRAFLESSRAAFSTDYAVSDLLTRRPRLPRLRPAPGNLTVDNFNPGAGIGSCYHWSSRGM